MSERPQPTENQFKINFEPTSRGFLRGDFEDSYGQKCSLQESSADFNAIWLGVNIDADGKESSPMHLTQEQVRELLPHLQKFVETGKLDSQKDKVK